jgi:hypothetical protein
VIGIGVLASIGAGIAAIADGLSGGASAVDRYSDCLPGGRGERPARCRVTVTVPGSHGAQKVSIAQRLPGCHSWRSDTECARDTHGIDEHATARNG